MHCFKSITTVGRFVSRAISTAVLTATVVVPEPPLAPRNTCVTQGWRAPAVAASRRAAVRRIAPWKDSSNVRPPAAAFHAKNSFAPARIACRISSGSDVDATAKIETCGMPRPQTLDSGHAGRSVGPDVDDEDIGHDRLAGAPLFDDRHRDTACAQHARHFPLALLVVTENRNRELGHGLVSYQSPATSYQPASS